MSSNLLAILKANASARNRARDEISQSIVTPIIPRNIAPDVSKADEGNFDRILKRLRTESQESETTPTQQDEDSECEIIQRNDKKKKAELLPDIEENLLPDGAILNISTENYYPSFVEPNIVNSMVAERMAPISEEDKKLVTGYLQQPSDRKLILFTHYNIPMSAYDFHRLTPEDNESQMLTDEAISLWMVLLQERHNRSRSVYGRKEKFWFCNSFFMERLLRTNKGYYYRNVHRWTKNIDISMCSKIFFPVNVDNIHWGLVVVCMKLQEIHWYDSLYDNSGEEYMEAIRRWIRHDINIKKHLHLDTSTWALIEKNPPKQHRSMDCGVFVCMYADYLSHYLPLDTISQKDMKHFRMKLAVSLCKGYIDYRVI